MLVQTLLPQSAVEGLDERVSRRRDPSTHADAMREDLAKLGIATELVLIPDAPHAFLGRARAFAVAVDACDRFFTKHLKKSL